MSSRFDSDIEKAKAAVDRYHKSKNIQELNEAVKAWERILRDTGFAGTDTEFRLNVLDESAETFFLRYKAIADFNDLNRVITLQERAVYLAEKEPSSELAMYLKKLDKSMREFYIQTENFSDLEHSISISQQVVDLIRKKDPNSPELPVYLNNMGDSLMYRYTKTQHISDLAETVKAYQEAVDISHKNSPDLHIYLNRLGNSLKLFYDKRHDISFLKQAVNAYKEAVDLSNKNSPNFHIYLNNLKVAEELLLNLYFPV